jgi:hypothetical protein
MYALLEFFPIAVNTCKNRFKSSEYRQKKKTVSLDNPGKLEGGAPCMEIRDESDFTVIEGTGMK